MTEKLRSTVIVIGLMAALVIIVTNQASSGSSLRKVKIKPDGIAPIAFAMSANQEISDE